MRQFSLRDIDISLQPTPPNADTTKFVTRIFKTNFLLLIFEFMRFHERIPINNES